MLSIKIAPIGSEHCCGHDDIKRTRKPHLKGEVKGRFYSTKCIMNVPEILVPFV